MTGTKGVLTFGIVLDALAGIHPAWANQVITEAVIDSRKAIPGSLFVAIPGEHADGHTYIEDAFERGAHRIAIQGHDSGNAAHDQARIRR